MPGRTNRILVTAAGVTHRSQLAYWLRDIGCIAREQVGIGVRRSGGVHRPPSGAAENVVRMMALGNAWRSAKAVVRDQGLTDIAKPPIWVASIGHAHIKHELASARALHAPMLSCCRCDDAGAEVSFTAFS